MRGGGGRRKEGEEDEKECWLEKGRGGEKKREGERKPAQRHRETPEGR